jgi:hypothetical protein
MPTGRIRVIDTPSYRCQYLHMDGRRVTVNLPTDLLQEAMAVTGQGITETLINGLKLVRKAGAFQRAMRLRGKLHLDVGLEESRERRRT